MEEPTDFHDWELLLTSDTAGIDSPKSDYNSISSGEIVADSGDGVIKSDYFALDSEMRYVQEKVPSESDTNEEGLADSDHPGWMDPDSDSRYLGRTKGELGSEGIELPHKDSVGFCADGSSDGQKSIACSEKEESFPVEGSEREVGFGGVEAGHENSYEFGGIEKSEGNERGGEKTEALECGEVVKMGGDESNSSVEKLPVGEGEKRGLVWWKLPVELLKFCVFRVRPVWSIPIAAAILGVVMLGRKLYKMKHKSRRIPLKVSIDDKKASQFNVRVARLNEAVARHVPIIRSQLPVGGVTPWPVLGLL